ncbi:MAG TPA: FAD-dependent monooxygenase, partial [Caulobacteraceae bacterium]|nr:FAD-dependent monooxygenase [Caulobacteraceae bacterium]
GALGVCTTRAALQAGLTAKLGTEGLTLGARVESISQDGRSVEAVFTDGRRANADLLIGADGLHSTVRRVAFGDEEPRYVGYGAWLGLAQTPMAEQLAGGGGNETMHQGQRFGWVAAGPHQVYWFFVEARREPISTPQRGGKDEVAAKVKGWHDPIPTVVARTPEDRITYVSLFHRGVRRGWSDRRVVLVGDAIHPILPNAGQGACQAIEDAAVLGAVLSGEPDLPSALRAYERRRLDRARSVARDSVLIGNVGQLSHPMLCGLRNAVLSAVLPIQMHRTYRQMTPPVLT